MTCVYSDDQIVHMGNGGKNWLLMDIMKRNLDGQKRLFEGLDHIYYGYSDFDGDLGFYRKLWEDYPNAKYILTWREKNSWIKSMMDDQFESFGDYPKPSDLSEMYDTRLQEIRKFFGKDGRRKNYMEMNICHPIKGDGWWKLCNFLDVPIPEGVEPHGFPHFNISRKMT